MSTLCEDMCTFVIVSCLILLRMGNVSRKGGRENQNTHFMFSENCAVCEIMRKNMLEPDRPQVTM
jgi:hypothetical protein